jgi:hypothetical protein
MMPRMAGRLMSPEISAAADTVFGVTIPAGGAHVG